jgi:hypothetical protein
MQKETGGMAFITKKAGQPDWPPPLLNIEED